MGVYVNTNVSLAVDGFEIAGHAKAYKLDGVATKEDFTGLRCGGWGQYKGGLASCSAAAEGFQDYATTGVDSNFSLAAMGALATITTGPSGGDVVGDVAVLMQGVLTKYSPLTAPVGKPAEFALEWGGSGRIVRGQYLHPNAARVASGNGTATAFTPPTATQSLFATFHVLEVTGAGTITFNVQTDDNSGMTTPTTRITSSAFAAAGLAQMASLAGALSGETHARVTWTIAGFTSVTFIVAAGVSA